jgi:hypothetical protein
LQLEFFQKEKRSTKSNRLWRLLKADSWTFQLVPEGVDRVRMLRIRRRSVLGVASRLPPDRRPANSRSCASAPKTASSHPALKLLTSAQAR